MRIVVDIPDAYVELMQELEGYAPRQRAGRLRMLATLGLATVKGGIAAGGRQQMGAHVPPPNTAMTEDESRAEEKQKTRSDMGRRMLGSLMG